MRFRNVVLLFLLLLLAIFAVANWTTIAEPATLNLLVGVVQAPLGLLLLTTVGFLTALYAIMLMSIERRLLREAARTSRELEEERRRRRDSDTEEIQRLSQTLTHDSAEVREILGRLVSQVSELRSLVAGRVARPPSADDVDG